MHGFEVGQEIGVRCDITPGPFSNEYLVTFETVSGPISGFVVKENLVQGAGEENYVHAIVRDVEASVISIWISGSFFTTTGLAQIPPHIAASLR